VVKAADERIVHRRGVTDASGLFYLGSRDSTRGVCTHRIRQRWCHLHSEPHRSATRNPSRTRWTDSERT